VIKMIKKTHKNYSKNRDEYLSVSSKIWKYLIDSDICVENTFFVMTISIEFFFNSSFNWSIIEYLNLFRQICINEVPLWCSKCSYNFYLLFCIFLELIICLILNLKSWTMKNWQSLNMCINDRFVIFIG
jgi:hypothetical protein